MPYSKMVALNIPALSIVNNVSDCGYPIWKWLGHSLLGSLVI